jgi:hypothetical protein
MPEEAIKSRLAVELIQKSEYTKSLDISTFPKETKTLSSKGVDVVKNFIKKEKGSAYGSFTAEAQLPAGELAKGRGVTAGPVIGDIDVQLKVSEIATQAKATKLVTQLQKIGEDVRISPENPTLIEKNIGGTYAHAVDIHSIESPLDQVKSPIGAYGFKFGQPTIKIEKIDTMPLSEFRTRKAASILTVQEEGTFNPAAHRMKDIPDFLTSQEYLTKVSGNSQDLAKISTLKNIYAEQGLLPSAPTTTKVPIYSPTVRPSSSSVPIVSSPTFKGSTPIMTSMKLPSTSTPLKSASASVKVSSYPSISFVSSPLSSVPSPSIPRGSLASMGSVSSGSTSTSMGSISPSSVSPSLTSSSVASLTSVSPSMPSTSAKISPKIVIKPYNPIIPGGSLAGFEEPTRRYRLPERTRKEKKKYVPSLTALLSNFKSKRGKTKGFLGTELRPIIVSKSRSKKR